MIALEPAWEARLAAVAANHGLVDAREPARLGAAVAALSAQYNRWQRSPLRFERDADAARLGFFFPRDLAKGEQAMREVIPALPDRALSILDLGAGLGATGLGAVRALRAAGRSHPVSITAIDRDEAGLRLGHDLARHFPGVLWTPIPGDVVRFQTLVSGRYDVVLVGQTLCELDPDLPEEERTAAHAAWLLGLLREHVADDGALVVIDPALKEVSRHLQRVRDAMLADGVAPFAPCLHAGRCPMLARPGDWCHEHRDVDLPAWLGPVARAAGLRWEGLTFAFMAWKPDGSRRPGAVRVVSEPMPSKGRRDLWVCGQLGAETGWRKIGRLDRHRTAANAAFDALGRGDVLAADPGVKIGPETEITTIP